MKPLNTRQAGFTLVETLVALFILALVSVAGTSLLLGATSAGKQIRERDSSARQIDLAGAFIRNDIAAMSARAIQPNDGFSQPGNLFGESAPSENPVLSFVRSGWINPGNAEPRSDLQAVEYRLENGNLLREATVRPDRVSDTPVSQRVLLRNVTRIDMRFQRGDEWSPDWIGDSGQPLSILPDLIEMSIGFADGRELTIAALAGGRT